MKKTYTPVKTSWYRRLEAIRLHVVPVVVFLFIGLLVALLWTDRVQNPSFVGVAEGPVADIVVPETGLIRGLHRDIFDFVHRGDLLAYIEVADSARIQSSIGVLSARIAQLEADLDPLADWQRNRINYAGLRLDLMQERIALASTQIREEQLEREADRARTLSQTSLISPMELEQAELNLKLVREEVHLRKQQIVELEGLIAAIDVTDSRAGQISRDPVLAAVQVYEQEIRALEEELKPVPVRAPFDGYIVMMSQFDQTYINRGDVLLQLASPRVDHIVGYVRQPFTVRPEPGMLVQVRTRTPERHMLTAEIDRVGARVTIIDEVMQRPGMMNESGLPVRLKVVDDSEALPFIPGEIVDLIIQSR